MANPNHLDNFTLTFTLDPPPSQQAGFSNVLVIADEANGTTLGGDRFRTYTQMEGSGGVDADITAGEVSAFVGEAARTAFSQLTPPPRLLIGRRDSVGGESYPDALGLIEAAGADYFGVAIESRADADITAFSAVVETRDKLVAVQSDDAGFLTGTYPAALTALQTQENTIICWHDEDTEWFDVGYLANRLAFDPDEISVPWDTGIDAVDAYLSDFAYPGPGGGTITSLTQTQKDFLDTNNVNHGLELGAETFFVDPGVNAAGRPIYEMVSLYWFKARMLERLAVLKTKLSRRGQKLTIDASGQAKVLAQVEALFSQGSSGTSPHFIPGQTRIDPVTITEADRDAQRLRFTGAATFAVSARKFNFTFNFTRQPIFTDAELTL